MRYVRSGSGFLFLAFVLLACNRKAATPVEAGSDAFAAPHLKPPATATVVRMRKTGCFGSCPAFELEIRANGTAVWRGDRNVARMGKYQTKVSRSWLSKVLKSAEKAGFFQLPYQFPLNGRPIPDLPVTTTFLDYNGKINKVENAGDAPLTLLRFERMLVEKLETLKWEHMKTIR